MRQSFGHAFFERSPHALLFWGAIFRPDYEWLVVWAVGPVLVYRYLVWRAAIAGAFFRFESFVHGVFSGCPARQCWAVRGGVK